MYETLQQYWWFLVSLLGALLVFMLFVQGGQSLVWSLGKNEAQRRVLLLATGRKWGITFTTLATFGGAFFASFPLFYSTSFGGAYWVWMAILHTFVVQAVSYEFRVRRGNLLGAGTFSVFLFINGLLAPLLIGTAVGTFFNGAEFVVDKAALTSGAAPVISSWANPLHGLEAALNPWNLCLGAVLVFLSRLLACLYFLNCVADGELRLAVRRHLMYEAAPFLVFFLLFVGHWLTQDGVGVTDGGMAYMESCKYLHNLLAMPAVACTLLAGVVLVLLGIIRPLLTVKHRGIWYAGAGTVLTVLALLLCAGWNNTAYYPSIVNLQSSLTIRNSCSSEFTLRTMAYVSILIPFVLAYIVWAWRVLDREPVKESETNED